MRFARERNDALLGILQSHAPNGQAQSLCAKFVNDLVAGGAEPEEVEKALVNALADGFNHANWLWVNVSPR